MTDKEKDNLFYICSLIEYVARKTHNKVSDVLNKLSDEDLKHELKAAEVNHSLSFEQVSDEWILEYQIDNGNFDNISICKYNVPTYTSIGKVYQRLILNVSKDGDYFENIRKVYNSFISEAISNFNSSVYYSNSSYILESYLAGELLD